MTHRTVRDSRQSPQGTKQKKLFGKHNRGTPVYILEKLLNSSEFHLSNLMNRLSHVKGVYDGSVDESFCTPECCLGRLEVVEALNVADLIGIVEKHIS